MRYATTMFVAATCLSACAERTPPTTMDLLRKGDASTCVAQDVEATLRRLILPQTDADTADAYSITLDATTMKRFDEPLAKMVCSTSVRIVGPMRPIVEDQTLDYTITASARDPATFVIAGPTAQLRDAVATEMGIIAQNEADLANEEAARQRMTALVKPVWLIGRWVRDDAGSSACISGPYATFTRGGRFESSDEKGRWQLDGLTLSFTTPSQSVRLTITEAEVNHFATQDEQGGTAANRRCTDADRKEAIAALPTTAGMDDIEAIEAEAERLPDLTQQR